MPSKSKNPLNRDYVSLSEIAKKHGIGRHAVYQKVKRNKIPCEMIGNIIVVKRKNLPLLGYRA
jgi:predicted DNA-binding protein YlxM (UPF0122 family)